MHMFDDLFSIRGKVALVTGGSRGIGEMIAAGLLAQGAKVYISARNADACHATAARLSERFGASCRALPANLAELDGIQSLVDQFGKAEQRLDILVNNAGVAWVSPLDDFPESGWDKVMDTNLKGVFFLTQRLLPLLRASATAEDPARVINIGSVDGMHTSVFNAFSYGASKAGLHHLTRMLAARLVRQNIIVNAIAPGPFPTHMLSIGVGGGGDVDAVDWERMGRNNPRGRIGTPQDIAGLAIFLSSRAGAFTVGEVISCDGGTLAST
jgi:NAD(P)-dependent dehydrogenase (short-subunit alcohol dehydrogenase family)